MHIAILRLRCVPHNLFRLQGVAVVVFNAKAAKPAKNAKTESREIPTRNLKPSHSNRFLFQESFVGLRLGALGLLDALGV